jgi:hypothetical protein
MGNSELFFYNYIKNDDVRASSSIFRFFEGNENNSDCDCGCDYENGYDEIVRGGKSCDPHVEHDIVDCVVVYEMHTDLTDALDIGTVVVDVDAVVDVDVVVDIDVGVDVVVDVVVDIDVVVDVAKMAAHTRVDKRAGVGVDVGAGVEREYIDMVDLTVDRRQWEVDEMAEADSVEDNSQNSSLG